MELTHQVVLLRQVAEILLPGDGQAPAAAALDDLDQLIAQAVRAIGREAEDLLAAVELLPAVLDWGTLKAFSDEHRAAFDIVSTIVAAAYFMSPAALAAIGYPQGPRRAPRMDQVVDEIETGVLETVLARGSMVREVPA